MRTRASILSFGISLLGLSAASAQAPAPQSVPYPLNVKPSTPQGTLTGVPAMPTAKIAAPGAPLAIAWAPVKPQTRVFDVADLVHAPLVIPGAAALENTKAAHAHTLMKMIVSLTKPDSWERGGGAGTIAFVAASDCLCITNAPDVLADVQKLIEGLRRMQEGQVILEVQLVTAPAGFGAKAGWPTAVDKGKPAPKCYSPEELKTAVAAMQRDNRVNVVGNPKIVLSDGRAGLFQILQTVEVPKASGDAVQTVGASSAEIGTKFECLPTVSVDGKTIALKLDTHYSILNNGGGVSTMQNRSGVSLPCGNSAIVHLGTITVRERFETRVPALSTLPYLDRLFRTTGIGSVEQDVYQIVTVRIVKEAQPVKSSCTATKPVVVPKQTFSCGIGWFGGQ